MRNKMAETNLNYKNATLALPGTLRDIPYTDEIKAVGSSVRFCAFDCHVTAYLDTGIWNRPELKQEYAEPVAQLVTRDLSTIADLLPQLTRLSLRRKAPDQLMYSKEPDGGFRVYDCMSLPLGRVFPTMLGIKKTEKRFLNPKFKDLAILAENIGKEEGKISHVEGNSLRVAVSSAIEIYKLADRIRSL